MKIGRIFSEMGVLTFMADPQSSVSIDYPECYNLFIHLTHSQKERYAIIRRIRSNTVIKVGSHVEVSLDKSINIEGLTYLWVGSLATHYGMYHKFMPKVASQIWKAIDLFQKEKREEIGMQVADLERRRHKHFGLDIEIKHILDIE